MPSENISESLVDGGIFSEIHAGFGSTLDGTIMDLAICDDCAKLKIKEGIIVYKGDSLGAEWKELKADNEKAINRRENLDKLV